MISEKKLEGQEVLLQIDSPLPKPPPPSKTFLDGFAAALWGTVLGSGVSAIAVVSLVLHLGGDSTRVYEALGIMTSLSVVGCLVHLGYKKEYHRVTDPRHFFNILVLGFILGLLMFLILPGLIAGFFLWTKFRSIREESQVINGRLNSRVKMPQINSGDTHAACC